LLIRSIARRLEQHWWVNYAEKALVLRQEVVFQGVNMMFKLWITTRLVEAFAAGAFIALWGLVFPIQSPWAGFTTSFWFSLILVIWFQISTLYIITTFLLVKKLRNCSAVMGATYGLVLFSLHFAVFVGLMGPFAFEALLVLVLVGALTAFGSTFLVLGLVRSNSK
jgi:hypothetical protein